MPNRTRPRAREFRHAEAAWILGELGASDEEISAQLLMARPSGSSWTVETLLNAGRSAMRKGAPESAAAYLRRAGGVRCQKRRYKHRRRFCRRSPPGSPRWVLPDRLVGDVKRSTGLLVDQGTSARPVRYGPLCRRARSPWRPFKSPTNSTRYPLADWPGARGVTATKISTAFYAFGLILLSTLAFVGFVTSDRVLQSGIEDLQYAQRIARLRAYYFDFAPELTRYLASVQPSRRLAMHGLHGGYTQVFRTVAGMIGVVTAVLTGSAAGLLGTIVAGHSAVAGFATGVVVGVAALVALMWFQYVTWGRARREQLFEGEQEDP